MSRKFPYFDIIPRFFTDEKEAVAFNLNLERLEKEEVELAKRLNSIESYIQVYHTTQNEFVRNLIFIEDNFVIDTSNVESNPTIHSHNQQPYEVVDCSRKDFWTLYNGSLELDLFVNPQFAEHVHNLADFDDCIFNPAHLYDESRIVKAELDNIRRFVEKSRRIINRFKKVKKYVIRNIRSEIRMLRHFLFKSLDDTHKIILFNQNKLTMIPV